MMAEALGMTEGQVVLTYGKPDLLPAPESIVYLVSGSISPDDGDQVKIGYTRHIRIRLEVLQSGSPVKLWLLAYREGGRDLGGEIHGRLAHCRIREEWFACCDDVRREFGLPTSKLEVAA